MEKKKLRDKRRAQTRVNIGESFEDWRTLKEKLNIKFDAKLARILVDLYKKWYAN